MVNDLLVQLDKCYQQLCQHIESNEFELATEQMLELQSNLENIFDNYQTQLLPENVNYLADINQKLPDLLSLLADQGEQIEQELANISRSRARIIAKKYHI